MQQTKLGAARWGAAIPLALTLLAPAAQAAFINEAAATAATQPVSAEVPTHTVQAQSLSASDPTVSAAAAHVSVIGNGPRVTEIGFHPSDVPAPKGRGRDIALADVLPVVVPADFHVDTGNLDLSQPVSWSGGLPWDTVLSNALRPLPNVHITLDWNTHFVALRRVASPVVQSSAPAAQTMAPAQGSHQNPVRNSLESAPAPAPRFNLLGGQSLEIQLTEWAKQAGWSITWSTPDDWIVPHDSSYGGDFQDAIKSVFGQLADDGADVRADIWQGNKTVVVDKAGVTQ